MRTAARYISRRLLSSGVNNNNNVGKGKETETIFIQKAVLEQLQGTANKVVASGNEYLSLKRQLRSISEECERVANTINDLKLQKSESDSLRVLGMMPHHYMLIWISFLI